MAPRPSTSSKQKKTAATRSSSSRRHKVSAREIASLEAERGSPPRTVYNQSVSDEEVEGSGDELASSSYAVPINAPGPLLKHSHPDSVFWRAFDNDESRRIVTLFSTDGVNTTYSASSLYNILLSAAPIFSHSRRGNVPLVNSGRLRRSSPRIPFDFRSDRRSSRRPSLHNLSGYLELGPDRSVKQNLRAASKGPLYLLGPDFHIPAVEASPMPKSAASSKRLAPADDDSDVEMPAPSKKSRLQEVEVLVSSPPRSTARARKTSPAASSSRKDAPPLRTSVAPVPSKRGAAREAFPVVSSSKRPIAAPTSRKEVLETMFPNPPGPWAEGDWPSAALEVVSSTFVRDACVPTLFSNSPVACLSCINRGLAASCNGQTFFAPCSNCRNGNTRCTFHPQRHRFGSLMEDLRPLLTLGPGALASSLLTAVRARQEADAAFRHLLYRLTVHEDGINEVVRTFSTQQEFLPEHFLDDSFEDPDDVQLLQQLSERVGANHLELELQYTDMHPTIHPFQCLADLSLDGVPDVYTQGYPPGVVAGPSTIDEIPGIENISRSVFAGADTLEADASLPEVDPRVNPPVQPVSPHLARVTTPTFTSLSLGRAGPLLQTPPTPSSLMPSALPTTPLSKSVSFAPPSEPNAPPPPPPSSQSRQVVPYDYARFQGVPATFSFPAPTPVAKAPEPPAYEQLMVYEQTRVAIWPSDARLPPIPARPRLPASFTRGGFTVRPARSQKPEPPSSSGQANPCRAIQFLWFLGGYCIVLATSSVHAECLLDQRLPFMVIPHP
ncbi:hypothetical protein B0H12DRAFT_1072896 [Mycena haematopus]|nr:hypothetical protein B0H12DRAFT_1072896 [Mycena haematopus]